jgi:CMP-N-acetylneuraminic acid synthetase
MSNIVTIIPARGGSKSIPRKNLKLLNGRPLISYSIESSLKCGLRTIVSTDDNEIADVAKEYGAEVLMRPAHLAKDDTPMFDVLQHEVPRISPKPDLVLLLQPTSPLRKKVLIQMAIGYLENLESYDSVVSVEKVPEKYNPYAMILEVAREKRMLFRKLIGWKERVTGFFTGKKYVGPHLSGYPISQRVTRRQDIPQAYLPDGNIYLFKADNLKGGSFYGNKVLLLENEGTLNVNTLEDFSKAEEILKTKEA